MDPYTIDVDISERTLYATLRGRWNVETMRGYVDALEREGGVLARLGPNWWLIDMADFDVQTQAVTECARLEMPRCLRESTVIALVTSTALLAVQARRVTTRVKDRNFATRAIAAAWLTSQRALA